MYLIKTVLPKIIPVLLFILLFNITASAQTTTIPNIATVSANGEGYMFTLESTIANNYPFFVEPPQGGTPVPGYHYLWLTDEGNISEEQSPTFYFESAGSHNMTLVLTPRKKPEPDPTIVHSFVVTSTTTCTPQTACTLGNTQNDPIWFMSEPKVGKSVYLLVPLSNCGATNLPITYNIQHSASLVFDSIYHENQFSSYPISPLVPAANNFSFVKNWNDNDDDEFAVIKFLVSGSASDGDTAWCNFSSTTPPEIVRNLCVNASSTGANISVGPYDPNFKESNLTHLNIDEVTSASNSATLVQYKIHFQNIGEGPVDSITIKDIFPEHLTIVESSISYSVNPTEVSTSYVAPDNSVGRDHHTWIIGRMPIRTNGGALDYTNCSRIPGTQDPNQSWPDESTKGWVSFQAYIDPISEINYNMEGTERDTCYCLCNVAKIYFDDLLPIYTDPEIIPIGDNFCFQSDSLFDSTGKTSYAEVMRRNTTCPNETPPPPPPPPCNWIYYVCGFGAVLLALLGYLRRRKKIKAEPNTSK